MHDRGRHKSKAQVSGYLGSGLKTKALFRPIYFPQAAQRAQVPTTASYSLPESKTFIPPTPQKKKKKLPLPVTFFSNMPGYFITRTKDAAHRSKHLSPPHQQLQDPSALTDNPQNRGKGCFQISCRKSSSKIAAEFKSHSNYSSGGFLGFSFKKPI